jgi:limonene 1,2-monooxygenase
MPTAPVNGPKRFGIFQPPYNIKGINPTILLKRTMDLIVHADEFGLDEAWVGEHHSGGAELVGSPEVFLAAVSQLTRDIRLGTGVNSLSYHHPYNVAERLVLLDHLARGRAMMGFGPGQLVSDAHMYGIDVREQRRMMLESAEAIMRLVRGEVVTMETDWFTLRDAQLQMRPYNPAGLETVVAAVASPSGPTTAGRLGIGMLNMSVAGAGENLRNHWGIAQAEAAKAGTTITRDQWRLSNFMHLADTEEQARKDFRYGFEEMWTYLGQISVLPSSSATTLDGKIDDAIASGIVFCGTPDQAIEYIDDLTEQTGGFGTFLMNTNDFASPAAQKRSVELLAERVAPHYKGQLETVDRSRDWVLGKRNDSGETVWKDQVNEAIQKATEEYAAANA